MLENGILVCYVSFYLSVCSPGRRGSVREPYEVWCGVTFGVAPKQNVTGFVSVKPVCADVFSG